MAYTPKQKQKIFENICKMIANGSSLRTALNELNLIDVTTFFRWIRESESFSNQYARATTERADLMFEEMLDIADEPPKTTETKFGSAIDNGDIQNKRVRIDTRKWALSKMNPKKYGQISDKSDDENQENEIIIKIVE